MKNFPSARLFGRGKMLEAMANAKRLGHEMTEWKNVTDRWYSYCLNCKDVVRLERVGIGAIEWKGAAAVLRCKKG